MQASLPAQLCAARVSVAPLLTFYCSGKKREKKRQGGSLTCVDRYYKKYTYRVSSSSKTSSNEDDGFARLILNACDVPRTDVINIQDERAHTRTHTRAPTHTIRNSRGI